MSLLGAHMPTGGRPERALEKGARIGCEIVQLFVKSPLRWSSRPLDRSEAEAFLQARNDLGFPLVLAHAGYLINLCSPDTDFREKSLSSLFSEVQRCFDLAVDGLVLHPGAHLGRGEKWAVRTVQRSLERVLDHFSRSGMQLLIENTAGQGTTIGCQLVTLAEIVDPFPLHQVGICLDTAHLYAAGYDLATDEGLASLAGDITHSFGWDRVRLLHLNDTSKPLGSRVDRHWHIGDGRIGEQGFARLLEHIHFSQIPCVIETPEAEKMHRVNLNRLKRLRDRGIPAGDGTDLRRHN